MKTHTTLGRDAILAAERLIQTPRTFLRYAREIAAVFEDSEGAPRVEAVAGARQE